MVNHIHGVSAPEFLKILLVSFEGEGFEKALFPVVEFNLLQPVFHLIHPGYSFAIS